jgi:hypothetical protein
MAPLHRSERAAVAHTRLKAVARFARSRRRFLLIRNASSCTFGHFACWALDQQLLFILHGKRPQKSTCANTLKSNPKCSISGLLTEVTAVSNAFEFLTGSLQKEVRHAFRSSLPKRMTPAQFCNIHIIIQWKTGQSRRPIWLSESTELICSQCKSTHLLQMLLSIMNPLQTRYDLVKETPTSLPPSN